MPKIYPGYLYKRKTSLDQTIHLSFPYLIILKILTFSYTLLSPGRPSRKTSAIRTYHDEEKIPRKKFHLQETTKTPLKPWKSVAC